MKRAIFQLEIPFQNCFHLPKNPMVPRLAMRSRLNGSRSNEARSLVGWKLRQGLSGGWTSRVLVRFHLCRNQQKEREGVIYSKIPLSFLQFRSGLCSNWSISQSWNHLTQHPKNSFWASIVRIQNSHKKTPVMPERVSLVLNFSPIMLSSNQSNFG